MRPIVVNRGSGRLWAAWVTLVCVGASVAFVAWQVDPKLIFSNTTTAGGDTGAHVMLPAFLEHGLLAHGRLVGWDPQWYDGFPFPTFYFPLPDLLVAATNLFTNYNVAFKLITVLGSLTLPIAAWLFGALTRLPRPAPELMAVVSVVFLFNTTFTIDGGNLASTLAGEYDFSLGLSLALVFLGVVASGLRRQQNHALAASLLAATALCHILPTMFAACGASVSVIQGPGRKRIVWGLLVAAPAFAISAYWSIPFVLRLPYSTSMGWVKVTDYMHSMVPTGFEWAIVLAIVGAIAAFIGRHPGGRLLVVLAVVFGAGFILAPQGQLYNARLLPFWLLAVYMLAALGASELLRFLDRSWHLVAWLLRGAQGIPPIDRDPNQSSQLYSNGVNAAESSHGGVSQRDRRYRFSTVAMPLVLTALVLTIVAIPQGLPNWSPIRTAPSSFIPSWVRWNYSGYQGKAAWPAYHSLVETMAAVGKTHGCGRAMWEYSPQLNDFGTPMALMLLPYWTNGCIDSMEGLLFESSATTPYHFINQAELSAQPSEAMAGLRYGSLNVAAGVRHLQQLGVRYYMAVTPAAQQQANADPALKRLATSGPWNTTVNGKIEHRTWVVYQVQNSAMVVPLHFRPVVAKGNYSSRKAWLGLGMRWYLNPAIQSVELAGAGPASWKRVALGNSSPPKFPEPATRITAVSQSNETLRFHTSRPGVPVLVKVSYFPNWHAQGARGPWRVAPNLMVVIPTSQNVELTYGWSNIGIAGSILTILGLSSATAIALFGRRKRRRHVPTAG